MGCKEVWAGSDYILAVRCTMYTGYAGWMVRPSVESRWALTRFTRGSAAAAKLERRRRIC